METMETTSNNRPFYFSKSKYCGFWQCPKIAWLDRYKPEEREIDPSLQARFEAGDEVGDLAMGLFGDFVEVTAFKDDGHLDLRQMIEATQAEMAAGTPVICEASFSYNGLYCAVDILKREGDSWAIYEVKSSSHGDKQVYAADVAYQKYVLEHCGVTVTGTYLVHLNSEYVFDGELKLDEFFAIDDIAGTVAYEEESVEANIERARQVLASTEEPTIPLTVSCFEPYRCAFWNYCTRDLPSPSVFDIYRLGTIRKLGFYASGKVSFEDLLGDDGVTNEKQRRQIEHALTEREDHVDHEHIARFLEELTFPLYFLDFETVQPVIPRYIGTKPYSQVPFQYSLHIINSDGAPLEHREFLAESGTDPRRVLAEQLCADIPLDGTVIAYNMSFEQGRIRELAEIFPDLRDHLLGINSRMKDLLVPFSKGWYYNRAMGGSFSIKSVLPALFPNDPALDYSNLPGIHNGSEAMDAFPALECMPSDEREAVRQSLLKYCELDTYAMVKVWEKLREA